MRYIVAFVGALSIFVGTFILSALLAPVLPDVLKQPVNLGIVYTNYPVGWALALLAGTLSWRGTLRQYAKKTKSKDPAPPSEQL